MFNYVYNQSSDEKQNTPLKMELPIVNHPEYVAKINENSVFPIKKFSALANYLFSPRP